MSELDYGVPIMNCMLFSRLYGRVFCGRGRLLGFIGSMPRKVLGDSFYSFFETPRRARSLVCCFGMIGPRLRLSGI